MSGPGAKTSHQGQETDHRPETGPWDQGLGTRVLGPRIWDQGGGGQKWTVLAPAPSPKLSNFMVFIILHHVL